MSTDVAAAAMGWCWWPAPTHLTHQHTHTYYYKGVDFPFLFSSLLKDKVRDANLEYFNFRWSPIICTDMLIWIFWQAGGWGWSSLCERIWLRALIKQFKVNLINERGTYETFHTAWCCIEWHQEKTEIPNHVLEVLFLWDVQGQYIFNSCIKFIVLSVFIVFI